MSEQLSSGAAGRRRFLGVCSMVGLGQTLLPGVLLGMAAEAEGQTVAAGSAEAKAPSMAKITPAMIDAAAVIAGITVTDEQKAMMLDGLTRQRESVAVIRTMQIPNSVAPAFVFDPVPARMILDTVKLPMRVSAAPDVERLAAAAGLVVAGVSAMNAAQTAAEEALAFASVRELGELVKTRKVTSLALTKMYLSRLKRYDSKLHFVITLTEERALKQAAAADEEIAAGRYRGPLHGIPWGAKDLLAVKGYRTTWGAAGF